MCTFQIKYLPTYQNYGLVDFTPSPLSMFLILATSQNMYPDCFQNWHIDRYGSVDS